MVSDDGDLLPHVRKAAERLRRQDPAPAAVPDQIAGFRILGVLGEGGMGVVYEAEQQEPQRRVALKVLRPGRAGPAALRRFADEARVLARLQHPGIAQIHAAGTFAAPGGAQPFFAMEQVRGLPLDVWRRERRPDRGAVLRLFGRLCEAVHHAHQKGVVHRDLKPSNILVDDDDRPKVLDFGVARVLDDEGQSLRTLEGQLVGTLCYMSPEQLRAEPGAVDVRSDVYTLGVLLFELLAGELPFPVRGRPPAEVLRILDGGEPQRLGAVARDCRGDLQTIVGKALARDPGQRYPSADALGQDVQRCLRREPIAARPPSAVYWLSRFVLRHRWLVAAAGVAVLALLGGAGVAFWQMLEARHQTGIAVGVNRWFDALLTQADPNENGSADLTLRAAIERAGDRVADIQGPPEVEARVRLMLGHAFRSHGDLARARTHLEACLRLRQGLLAPPHDDLAEVHNALGLLYERLGLDQETIASYQTAGDQFRALHGEHDERYARAVLNVGAIHLKAGRLDQAEPLVRKGVMLLRAIDPDHAWLGTFLAHLASLAQRRGDLGEAEACLRETLGIYERTGHGDHPYASIAMSNLGQVLCTRREFAAAEPLYRRALTIMRARFATDHAWVKQATDNLAGLYRAWDRPDQAAAVDAGVDVGG